MTDAANRSELAPDSIIDGSQLLKDRLEHEWGLRAEAATVSLARLIKRKVAGCQKKGLKSHFGHRIKTDSNCTQAHSEPQYLAKAERLRRRGRKVAPLPTATLKVMNAGLGKTATHAFHQEMCAAGLKSIHWDLTCNHVPAEAVKANQKILRLYHTLKKCAAGELRRTDQLCNATRYLETLQDTLVTLVTSGVEALSDAPYTDYVPYVQELVPNVRIAQTLREPRNYALRRLHWIAGTDTICKDPHASGAGSHWDTIGCLSGATYVADALATNSDVFRAMVSESDEDAALGAFGEKFVLHNRFIERRVRPTHLCQLCAWDSDFESTLDTMAKAMVCDKVL